MMKGVLDRFEDNDQAVILIEKEQKALVIPRKELPKGSKEGIWFHIKESNGAFKIISIDYETARREEKKSADLMEKLRAKGTGSKFKRK